MNFDNWRRPQDYPRVITIIGSGGKTSFLKKLRDFFLSMGEKVVVTTTTKMWAEDFNWINTKEAFAEVIERGNLIYLGEIGQDLKVREVKELSFFIRTYKERAIFLIESDGSKGLAFKVPSSYEPVIVDESEAIYLIAGIHQLGKSFEESCHRLDEVLWICKKKKEDRVGLEDIYHMIVEGYFPKIHDLSKVKIILNGDLPNMNFNSQLWESLDVEVWQMNIKENSDGVILSKNR